MARATECFLKQGIQAMGSFIDIDDVIAFLKTEKPEMTHVCLTGRNAKDDLIDLYELSLKSYKNSQI